MKQMDAGKAFVEKNMEEIDQGMFACDKKVTYVTPEKKNVLVSHIMYKLVIQSTYYTCNRTIKPIRTKTTVTSVAHQKSAKTNKHRSLHFPWKSNSILYKCPHVIPH